MQTRAVRQTIFALLVLTALGAVFFTWDVSVRVRASVAAERAVDARLDRLSAAAAALGAAQQAYVAPGQQRGDALTRASVLVQQIYDDIAALRLEAGAAESASLLLAAGSATDSFVNVDDRVREHLRLDQELMAADLVYTEARQALELLASQLESLRAVEQAFASAVREPLITRGAAALVGTGLVWVLGTLLLVPVASSPAAATGDTSEQAAPLPPAPAERVESAPATARSDIDLAALATLCADVGKLSGTDEFPAVLARAAQLLDAPGLIVWLGAGEELFPAAAHGYSASSLARLGPIPRAADNATATSWRTGEVAVVSGTSDALGAVVAPLVNQTNGCFGVLAAEVRHGREQHEATRAAAAIVAAQLSPLLSPWPAASDTPAATASTAATA